ncbi:MAG: hypothetical protein KKC80_07205 [Candidatus Margulisbacteria bacterium]|nr:hypothetical protein [Candidatus Margulisiibacteriota bacterium]MBU1616972.1 hypothetical protein [Candidatus Margulisiibacteriota bacterium]
MSPVSYKDDLNTGFDAKSTIKSKYNEFVNILAQISDAMLDDSEVTFAAFPNKKVRPSDDSFNIYSTFAMDQVTQQIDSLIESVKKRSELDKMTYGLFG